MEKMCENCEWWKKIDGTPEFCMFWVIGKNTGTWARVSLCENLPGYLRPRTPPEFGCSNFQKGKRGLFSPARAIVSNKRGILFASSRGSDTYNENFLSKSQARSLCYWLNQLWKEHMPKVRFSVEVRDRDDRGQRWQPVIHLGDAARFDIGLRWYEEEDAIAWTEKIEAGLYQVESERE